MISPVGFGGGASSTVGLDVAAGVPLEAGAAGAALAACRVLGAAVFARGGALVEVAPGAATTVGVLGLIGGITSGGDAISAEGDGFEIPQDSADAEEKEYLMSTMELFEQWERKVKSEALDRGLEQGMKKGLEQGVKKGLEQGVKKGLEQGVKKGLVKLYRARFGELPPAIMAAIEAMHDPEALDRWLDLFEVKSADEIAAALDIVAARP